MAQVFLSYTRRDRERVQPLVTALQAQGYEVFWDYDLIPGEKWRERLDEELEKAEVILVLWSKKSVVSSEVILEAEVGRQAGKLAQVRIDAVEPPGRFFFVQYGDLTGWRGERTGKEWFDLCAGLDRIVGAPAAPKETVSIARAADQIQQALLAFGYRDRIIRLLDRVERVVDGAAPPGQRAVWRSFTPNLLDLTLLLALAYPALSFLIQFALLGESVRLGPVTLADAAKAEPWARAAIGGVVIGLLAVVLIQLRRRRRGRSEGAAGAVDPLAFAVAGAGAVAVAVAVAFAFAFTFTVAFAVALALVTAFVFAFAGGLAVAFAGAFAVAFESAVQTVSIPVLFGAFVCVVGLRWAGDRIGAPLLARLTIAALLGWGLFWALGVSDGLRVTKDRTAAETGAVLLFIVVLPLANALFDFLSIGLTRWLMRLGAAAKRGWTILLALFDLFAGLALFVGLGCASIWAIHMLRVGGPAGPTLIDLKAVLLDIQAQPWSYGWLYFTYFSTLIPTMIHAYAAIGALLDYRAGGAARYLAARLPDAPEAEREAIVDEAKRRIWAASLLAAPLGVLAVLGLVLALFWVGGPMLLEFFIWFAEQVGAFDGPRL
ncbi:MAG: toll/interleukin-1 receptor domain-containing protein [Neomegalonema sp.]|nr:toll/interleukin-1 receptor domain-containing protein [Neomegalonema sp.]